MKVDSLEELEAAFAEWRSGKRHPREPVPHELLERARRTIRVRGLGPVAKVTRIDRRRLGRSGTVLGKTRRGSRPSVPSFSRLELAAPAATSRPFAEVEMPSGLKVRIFSGAEDAIGVLSSLCGIGGAR